MDAEKLLADGIALWEEHKPQSADDWVEVAKRVLADPQGAPNASPLFAGLLRAQGRVAELERALTDADADVLSLVLITNDEVRRLTAEAAQQRIRCALNNPLQEKGKDADE